MHTCRDMSDKKAVNTFPIYFGESCYIGDIVLRRQYLEYMDRSVAAVTKFTIPECNERCSFWTPSNSASDELAGNRDENDAKVELRGGTTVGPAERELGSCNPVGPAEAMGPLNIQAAFLPFESTWSTAAAADVDNLSSASCKSSLGSWFEVQFDDDDDISSDES